MFNTTFVTGGIHIVNKLFKRELQYFTTPRLLLFSMQCMIAVIMILRGIGVYFLCIGIGFQVGIHHLPALIAAINVAETLGFIMLLAPGGLGIRESMMYLILDNVVNKEISLVLPIAVRVVTMCADILVGALSLVLFKTLSRQSSHSTTPI